MLVLFSCDWCFVLSRRLCCDRCAFLVLFCYNKSLFSNCFYFTRGKSLKNLTLVRYLEYVSMYTLQYQFFFTSLHRCTVFICAPSYANLTSRHWLLVTNTIRANILKYKYSLIYYAYKKKPILKRKIVLPYKSIKLHNLIGSTKMLYFIQITNIKKTIQNVLPHRKTVNVIKIKFICKNHLFKK